MTRVIALKFAIHTIHLAALVWLLMSVLNGSLGAEPVDEIIHFTGKSALNALLATLCITPLVRRFRAGWLTQCRRLAGLYCFGWAVLHLSAYLVLDLDLRTDLLFEEITSRPYLIIGAISWLILALLALTSFKAIMRKMGKTWQALHNWIYLTALLVPIHYLWSVKSAITEPVIYLCIAFLLLGFRKQKLTRWLSLNKPG